LSDFKEEEAIVKKEDAEKSRLEAQQKYKEES
jgi:hypothetical protein